MKLARLAALLALLPVSTFANQKTADSCASSLPKSSAAIYAASVKRISPGANIRDIVTSVTRGMVMSGDLGRGDAKPAAEAAGACLKLLRE
jgi:hypothetical protein